MDLLQRKPGLRDMVMGVTAAAGAWTAQEAVAVAAKLRSAPPLNGRGQHGNYCGDY